MPKIYCLFISRSWGYTRDYDRLMLLLKETGSLLHWDYVVHDEYMRWTDEVEVDEAVTRYVLRKMEECHVVLVQASNYVQHKDWVDKEIEIARAAFVIPKPIIAVVSDYAPSDEPIADLPADREVPLSGVALTTAIRELVD